MSGSTVIVAIPSEDDYTWKISSEKIPHMTLLFLGDLSNNPKLDLITGFVEHVASTMTRFGLDVDRRGALGPEDADVLFFSGGYSAKMLRDARSAMLQYDPISEAVNTSEQFPQWTPHLTLGYPATPAKPDERDYPGINWVNFDKIAVWTDDFEGPTFDLKKWEWSDEDSLTMSDDTQNFIKQIIEVSDRDAEQYGVRGMKWGVRKDDPSGSSSTTPKAKSSDDAKTASAIKTRVSEDGGNTSSLSNKELQDLVTRMNLEQQYSRLVSSPQGKSSIEKGHEKVKTILAVGKTANEVVKFTKSPVGKALRKKMTKAAFNAAMLVL